MYTEKLDKRNLLRYAEKIGGQKMYFGMRNALREAGVFQKPELNKRQIQNTLRKLVSDKKFHLDKTALEKLIDEHEKRRKAYVQLGIEEELKEEETEHPGAWSALALQGGKKRYEFRAERSRAETRFHSAGKKASSSILERSENISSSVFDRGRGAGTSGNAPITSISQLNRPKKA